MDNKKPSKVFDYLVVAFVVLMALAIGFSVYAANKANKKTTNKSTSTAAKTPGNTSQVSDPTQTTDQTNAATETASTPPPVDLSPANNPTPAPVSRHREDD
jgi:type IV secretory pathway VirB10-like protein